MRICAQIPFPCCTPTQCGYRHVHTDISCSYVCVLGEGSIYIQWRIGTGRSCSELFPFFPFFAASSHLWPCDEIRVHLLESHFLNMHMEWNLKRGRHSSESRNAQRASPDIFDFTQQERGRKFHFAAAVIYSLACNQISCARHEDLNQSLPLPLTIHVIHNTSDLTFIYLLPLNGISFNLIG